MERTECAMTQRRNSIFTIRPYMKDGIWMFDDATVGLKEEAFVSGADDMITTLTNGLNIRSAKGGFVLQFSNQPFPDAQAVLNFSGYELGGTWYSLHLPNQTKPMMGWLCPALNLYYPRSPRKLYVAMRQRG